MPEPKDVFRAINTAVNDTIRMHFGPSHQAGNEQLPAIIAVQLLQLSLRYFAETGAPKNIVLGFFFDLMGIEGHRGELVEEDGKLKFIEPKPAIVSVATEKAVDIITKRRRRHYP